jgi:hypothetical protein
MACHAVSTTKRDGGKVDGGLKLRWIEDAESDRQMTGRRTEKTYLLTYLLHGAESFLRS